MYFQVLNSFDICEIEPELEQIIEADDLDGAIEIWRKKYTKVEDEKIIIENGKAEYNWNNDGYDYIEPLDIQKDAKEILKLILKKVKNFDNVNIIKLYQDIFINKRYE